MFHDQCDGGYNVHVSFLTTPCATPKHTLTEFQSAIHFPEFTVFHAQIC